MPGLGRGPPGRGAPGMPPCGRGPPVASAPSDPSVGAGRGAGALPMPEACELNGLFPGLGAPAGRGAGRGAGVGVGGAGTGAAEAAGATGCGETSGAVGTVGAAGVLTSGADPGTSVGTVGLAAAGAFLAVFFAGAGGVSPGGGAGKASRSLRTTGASTVEEAERTNSPMSWSLVTRTLLSIPSSLASS